MGENVEQLCKVLVEAYDEYIKMDIDMAIQYVAIIMEHQIMPILSKYKRAAREYCEERDKKNVQVIAAMNEELNRLQSAFTGVNFTFQLLPMSSVTSGLNLDNGLSDVDFGLCIENFNDGDSNVLSDNQEIVSVVDSILRSNGYCPGKTIGYEPDWPFPTNRYRTYLRQLNGVEFEIKVRDLGYTMPLIALHKKLDSDLTQEKKELYTYGKLLLANTDCKKILKLFIYMEYFFAIEGRFKLPAV